MNDDFHFDPTTMLGIVLAGLSGAAMFGVFMWLLR